MDMENEIDFNELYERIFNLEDRLYQSEDKMDEMVQKLCHTHISLGEMEMIGELVWKY